MKKRLSQFAFIVMGSSLCYGAAQADVDSWVGTADYQQAPGGTTANADDVGPFNTYAFADGSPVLIQGVNGSDPQDPVAGDTFDGYFQTYVTGQLLNGVTVSSPKLDTQGAAGNASSGSYELTLASSFTETVTGATASSVTFNITGGSVNLYFDTNPNYSFTNDSGFTDGTSILTGTILGGTGSIVNGSLGVTSLDIGVSSYNANVFSPGTLSGGEAVFSLSLLAPGTQLTATPVGDITSVEGHTVNASTDVLAAATGDLVLAVPEPQAWMMMPVGLGLIMLATSRRRQVR